MQKTYRPMVFVLLAISLGIVTGMASVPFFHELATIISDIFIKFLRLISVPIIFLAILSTIIGMKNFAMVKTLGGRVLKYTLLTTVIASLVALVMYRWISPVTVNIDAATAAAIPEQATYLSVVLSMIPNNIALAFVENNVLGVVMIAFILGFATLTLPERQLGILHGFFDSFFQVFLKVAKGLIVLLPIGVWAFTALFVIEARVDSGQLSTISKYLACVLAANLIQAFVVLPLFLKCKGVSPLRVFKAVSPALLTAFFSKSSSATLPLTMKCLSEEGKVSKKVTNFSLPICSVINMNGCAAFILITVLFVAMDAGISFTFPEMLLWAGLATIAAVGNASVPMGCYFLASAFLLGMNVPLHLMGVILTVFVFLDMVETALNVWSDCAVTTVVDKEEKALGALPVDDADDSVVIVK